MSAPDSSTFDSVTKLYRDHHGWLSTWLRKKLGNSSDAADLAHDTFVRLMTGRRKDGAGPEPRALLTHIAKGLVVDHWRRRALEDAYLAVVAQLPPREAPSPEHRAQILETLHAIDTTLSALPAKTREIFLSSQFDGMTYADIATRERVSLATVKRHMQRALTACLIAFASHAA
ncbi:sigma-70 family RNA polymerase sigma factor [Achromobacter piechaudii]|uniref:RNA polymerase sigma factor FecI n=1 Tax=Achromobacter piechaudii TaxID=72556 RepID=A0ABM8L5U8_9BURK|nr:sigma-70 family RNA polymerase sigma factor [Achromobacter piechaudii]CAB3732827.1 putative RNA polymerase sigma factor FecI [Achromobacter piechaudii]CAB3912146.1 putative RNA polymerase sigma factor FecI [Achromobacter piechaudii]CAB3954971.1 putative RNA polymerase sigma factor FecI [Achromobacter piechaudii]